jgi:2-polyprenyl-3-methyl-5-hydroxy-6-metoxy-1,4-benzoquinol methylase
METNWNQYTSGLTGGTATDRRLLRKVARGSIIDVGCGIGNHLTKCDLATVKVGVDAGLPGLRKGKVATPELNLICGNVYQLPVRSSTFDAAIMIDVVEHIEQPLTALQEVARTLHPGGVLFIQTPNYPIKRLYDFWHFVRGSRTGYVDDLTHVSKYNCSRLVSDISRVGFRVSLVISRNILLQKYLPALSRIRGSKIGRVLGQKSIVIAHKLG